MPFVIHRGQRIHYTVDGSGPLVVLQHGLLSSAQSWKLSGYVDALADRFRVACVDSLGHGLSDKPADRSLYVQAQRAGDIVAVIDELGAERAHLLGYSMGGWLAVGVAKHHPRRLASLTVGGWDFMRGLGSARTADSDDDMTFDQLIAVARSTAPMLVEWVTPEVEPGLRGCWDALSDLDGAEAAVLGLGAPVLLWSGREDPVHEPMRAFADAHGLKFLSTPGDHFAARMVHGAESVNGILAFFEAADARADTPRG